MIFLCLVIYILKLKWYWKGEGKWNVACEKKARGSKNVSTG
jgi:hypothetical protein